MTTQTAVAADTKPPKGRRDFDRANAKRGVETIKLPISMIRTRPGFNPRDLEKPTTQAKIKGLTASYKAGDFVRPIEVAFAKDYYEIVDGECRFTAAQMAGLQEMEVYPLNDVSEADRLVIAINGNQGETLTPMEMADVVERLKGMGIKREDIANKLHKTVGWIDRLIVLGKIHQDIRKHVNMDRIAMDVVVKIYQGDKSDGKLEARDTVLSLMDHYKDRVAKVDASTDPDALGNGEGSGIKITMRDYLDFLDAQAGGRRASDHAGEGDGGGEGEGEGDKEPKGKQAKSPGEKKPSEKDTVYDLAKDLAIALPDDYGLRKSQIRKTAEYTVTLKGSALLQLMSLQDTLVGPPEVEAEKPKGKAKGKGKGKAKS